jgi:hypothetical protein
MTDRYCDECAIRMPPFIPRKRKGDKQVCWACHETTRGGYVSAEPKAASLEHPTGAEGGEFDPAAVGKHLREEHGLGPDDMKDAVFNQHIIDNENEGRPRDHGIPKHDTGDILNFMVRNTRRYHDWLHQTKDTDHSHNGMNFTKPIEDLRPFKDDKDVYRYGDPNRPYGNTMGDNGGAHAPWRDPLVGPGSPRKIKPEYQEPSDPTPSRVMQGHPNSEMNGQECNRTFPDAERNYPEKGSDDDPFHWHDQGMPYEEQERRRNSGWNDRYICPDCHAYKALHVSDEWNNNFKDRMHNLEQGGATAPFKPLPQSLNARTAMSWGDYLREFADAHRADDPTRHRELHADADEADATKGVQPGEDLPHTYGNTVGWVKARHLKPYLAHQGDQHSMSPQEVGHLQDEFKRNGWKDAVMFMYHHGTHSGIMGEGNHRLNAQLRNDPEGYVPLRVVRAYDSEAQGGKLRPLPSGTQKTPDKYVDDYYGEYKQPEMQHPSEVLPDEWMHPGNQTTAAKTDFAALLDSLGFTYHPRVVKDMRGLDGPALKSVTNTLRAMQNGEPVQTHRMTPGSPLDGWFATKASRGHRIVHRPGDDGSTLLGHIGLHNYDEAIRRLAASDEVLPEVPCPQHPKQTEDGTFSGRSATSKCTEPAGTAEQKDARRRQLYDHLMAQGRNGHDMGSSEHDPMFRITPDSTWAQLAHNHNFQHLQDDPYEDYVKDPKGFPDKHPNMNPEWMKNWHIHGSKDNPTDHTIYGDGLNCSYCGESAAYHPHPHEGEWARCSLCNKDMSHHLHDTGRWEHLEHGKYQLPSPPVKWLFDTYGDDYGKEAARDQDSCPHDGGWNLHGQCKKCGYMLPTEGDEPCDNPWCVEHEPEHTKGEHIDPPHLDPGHPDYHSAEQNIEDAIGDHPDGWLFDHNDEGPSKFSKRAATACTCLGAEKIEPHTSGEHYEWSKRMHAAGRTDVWGHPVMQPYDGHDAWSCNNYDCPEHPQELYDYKPGQGAPGWMQHVNDPDRDIKREVDKTFHETGQHDEARWLLDQQDEGPSKHSKLAHGDHSNFMDGHRHTHIELSQDDLNAYQEFANAGKEYAERMQRAQKTPTDLSHPSELRQHMTEAHEEGGWVHSAPDDEVRQEHDDQHQEYHEDWPHAVYMDNHHFHEANRRTAARYPCGVCNSPSHHTGQHNFGAPEPGEEHAYVGDGIYCKNCVEHGPHPRWGHISGDTDDLSPIKMDELRAKLPHGATCDHCYDEITPPREHEADECEYGDDCEDEHLPREYDEPRGGHSHRDRQELEQAERSRGADQDHEGTEWHGPDYQSEDPFAPRKVSPQDTLNHIDDAIRGLGSIYGDDEPLHVRQMMPEELYHEHFRNAPHDNTSLSHQTERHLSEHHDPQALKSTLHHYQQQIGAGPDDKMYQEDYDMVHHILHRPDHPMPPEHDHMDDFEEDFVPNSRLFSQNAKGQGPFDRNDPDLAREDMKDWPKPIGPYSTYGDGPDYEFYRPQKGEDQESYRDRLYTDWSDENSDTRLRRKFDMAPNPDENSLGGEFVKRKPVRTCVDCKVAEGTIPMAGYKEYKGTDSVCDNCYHAGHVNFRGGTPGKSIQYDNGKPVTMEHGGFTPDQYRLFSQNSASFYNEDGDHVEPEPPRHPDEHEKHFEDPREFDQTPRMTTPPKHVCNVCGADSQYVKGMCSNCWREVGFHPDDQPPYMWETDSDDTKERVRDALHPQTDQWGRGWTDQPPPMRQSLNSRDPL